MTRFVRNDDGRISKDEAVGPMAQRFEQMDKNSDEVLTQEEIESYLNSRRQGGRPSTPR